LERSKPGFPLLFRGRYSPPLPPFFSFYAISSPPRDLPAAFLRGFLFLLRLLLSTSAFIETPLLPPSLGHQLKNFPSPLNFIGDIAFGFRFSLSLIFPFLFPFLTFALSSLFHQFPFLPTFPPPSSTQPIFAWPRFSLPFRQVL